VALAVQLEVGNPLNVVLSDHPQLPSHIVLLVYIQDVRGLTVGVGALILRHAHERRWLIPTTYIICRWIYGEVVRVFPREGGLSLVYLEVSHVEFEAH